MKIINIITVGYNEELNLPKLYKSLKLFNTTDIVLRIIYIDQSSTDKSVSIAKSYGAEVYIHENKGYADPDKKWAVENLLNENELCIMLDCDEELSIEFCTEIIALDIKVARVSINLYFMGKIVQKPKQIRIFKKEYVEFSEIIHEYVKIRSPHISMELVSSIDNYDLKNIGREIESVIEKTNRYTSKEIRTDRQYLILLKLIFMPIIWFFGWGIKNKNFLRGSPGWIHAILMAYYQFTLYAKLYEKSLTTNTNTGSK